MGISHSREERSFFSALAPLLAGRPASGGDRVRVCQSAGWEVSEKITARVQLTRDKSLNQGGEKK